LLFDILFELILLLSKVKQMISLNFTFLSIFDNQKWKIWIQEIKNHI